MITPTLRINARRITARNAIATVLWTDIANVDAYQYGRMHDTAKRQAYSAGPSVYATFKDGETLPQGWQLVGVVTNDRTRVIVARCMDHES